ncbi:MAG: hypothetical protein K2H64_04310 [Desulfovibrio sp.]|nr:hypothetical protein [Desulfovibrio sp.]
MACFTGVFSSIGRFFRAGKSSLLTKFSKSSPVLALPSRLSIAQAPQRK